MGMRLKRKLFFFGLGNIRTGASQMFKGITNRSVMNLNKQDMTGAQRFGSVMKGAGNITKGGLKFTAGVGGAALLAGGLAAKGIHDMATNG